MIKELIFSGKKFFEGEEPNYIGKTIKSPKNPIAYFISYNDGYLDPSNHTMIPDGTVKGVVTSDFAGGTYITNGAWWYKLTDLIQNGGVSSSPLTHLYQSFRHLLDRKVALVND